MEHIKLGIITGTGLDFADLLDFCQQKESMTNIFPEFQSQIEGHKYQILEGTLASLPIIICNGRIHAYEGYSFEQFKKFLYYFKEKGITHLILINAVGGLNKESSVGSFVAIEKIISIPYYKFAIPEILYPTWVFNEFPQKGTYIWVSGPSYETKAELRFFLQQGGDVVGMSGAPELYWALQSEIKTAMFS
ncbi:MAG TPA: hypothetical protein PLX23_10940, partial [Candidatus Hydrogenedens sp.]|nr:hypothetical protein [Candidatus Hydrogenedens sp.]